jgi:hypothetical protein
MHDWFLPKPPPFINQQNPSSPNVILASIDSAFCTMIMKKRIRRPLYYIVGCLTCCFFCGHFPRTQKRCCIPELPLDPLCEDDSPLPRKRALTLPLPLMETDISKEGQRTIEQSHQSLLFAKLPLELRIKIYEEVLSGKTIHIRREFKPGLRGYICLAKEDHKPCVDGTRRGVNKDLTALLLTCRQAYVTVNI